MSAEDAQELEAHFEGCARCRDRFPMLKSLRAARRIPHWSEPRRELVERAARIASLRMAPPEPRRAQAVEWQPADIRGRNLAGVPEPRTLNAVLAEAEVSIAAIPPGDDPLWQIEGCVWMRKPIAGDIEVVITHDDHVILHRKVESAEFFRIEELLPAGWQLEVHVPGCETLKLSDREP